MITIAWPAGSGTVCNVWRSSYRTCTSNDETSPQVPPALLYCHLVYIVRSALFAELPAYKICLPFYCIRSILLYCTEFRLLTRFGYFFVLAGVLVLLQAKVGK